MKIICTAPRWHDDVRFRSVPGRFETLAEVCSSLRPQSYAAGTQFRMRIKCSRGYPR